MSADLLAKACLEGSAPKRAPQSLAVAKCPALMADSKGVSESLLILESKQRSKGVLGGKCSDNS